MSSTTSRADEGTGDEHSTATEHIGVREATDLSFAFRRIGPAPSLRPAITNVQIVDVDKDGMQDVLACDAESHAVYLYRRAASGDWSEQMLGEGLMAPAHATIVDIDKDGDNDVLVSLMGNLLPDDNLIGSLVLLENNDGTFARRVILDDVRRVVDAQPGDFDGDGDLDIAVAVFGFARGQVLWLENRGDGGFRDHELHSAAGAIHVPVADYDGDGDLDIAAVISQDDEEVWGFENRGGGAFSARRLWMTVNFDIGSAGLVQTDLDGDGDPDLLLPVGDNLEDSYSVPQPYHGCLWLENEGAWTFAAQRISTLAGTYAAAAGDMDQDGDQDVVLCSMVNFWDSGAPSLVWLENDGLQRFVEHAIASDPIKLVTVATGDLSGDERPDIVAGGLHLYPPFDRLGRISSWVSRPGPGPPVHLTSDTAPLSEEPSTDQTPPLPNMQWTDPNVRDDLTGLHHRLVSKISEGTDGVGDWLELGKAYYAFGYFTAAMRCFERVINRDPASALGNYLVGVALQRTGRIAEARKQFTHTLGIAPASQHPLIWHEIGRCHLRLEEAARAEDAFIAAGDFPPSLFQLARLRIKLGRAEEALPALNALTHAQPGALEVYHLQAKAAAAMEMYDPAQAFRDLEEYTSKRLPAEPTYGSAISEGGKYGIFPEGERARRLVAERRWDEAAAVLKELIAARGGGEPVIMLAGIELERGNPEEAIRLIEEAFPSPDPGSKALLLLGDACLRSGQVERALKIWEEVERARPLEIVIHEKLAEHYDRIGETEAARRQEALMQESAGIATLRWGKIQAAATSLDVAVKLDPTLLRAWFYLGECHRMTGDIPAARSAYRMVLKLNPNHGRAHDRLERLAE